jgi:hypothetical protein
MPWNQWPKQDRPPRIAVPTVRVPCPPQSVNFFFPFSSNLCVSNHSLADGCPRRTTAA